MASAGWLALRCRTDEPGSFTQVPLAGARFDVVEVFDGNPDGSWSAQVINPTWSPGSWLVGAYHDRDAAVTEVNRLAVRANR